MSMMRISAIVFATLLLCGANAVYLSAQQPEGLVSSTTVYLEQVEEDGRMLLVDLRDYLPGAIFDMRYVDTNNFTGEVVYDTNLAYIRKPVAEALVGVQQELEGMGLTLKIFDAYRPYSATVKFYELIRDSNYVALPKYGSRHNRGCAVDLTLVEKSSGKELDMGTPFDDFTEKAGHLYEDLEDGPFMNRRYLRELMTRNGFALYEHEWWHYDFSGWEEFPLMNIDLKELHKVSHSE